MSDHSTKTTQTDFHKWGADLFILKNSLAEFLLTRETRAKAPKNVLFVEGFLTMP